MSSIVNIPNFSSGGSKGITKVERKTFISENNKIDFKNEICDVSDSIVFSITGRGRILEIIPIICTNKHVIGSLLLDIDTSVYSSNYNFCGPDPNYMGRKFLTNRKEDIRYDYGTMCIYGYENIFYYTTETFKNEQFYSASSNSYVIRGSLGYIPEGIPFNNGINIRTITYDKTTKSEVHLIVVYELYS